MPPSPDDLPLTVTQLAKEAGISPNTLRNWAKRNNPPLADVSGPRKMHTWAQLREFCTQHPELYKAPAIARRPAAPGSRRRSGASGAERAGSVADVRELADAHLNAIVEAVRAAEAAARAHREQLETLIGAYDEVVAAVVTAASRRVERPAPARRRH